MKRILPILALTCVFSSCTNTWDSEIKDMFHQSCLEDAESKTISEKHAKAYCDCVLERVMEKYPNYEDALMNIDSVSRDTGIQACKEGNFKESAF